MGFFGSLGAAAKRFATPDNLMMIGAALKDASAGGSDNFMGVQQAMLQRRQLAMKQEAQQRLSGLFGGQRSTVPMADEGGFAAAQPVPPRVSDMVEAAMMGGPGPSLEQVTARPQPRVPQVQQQDQIPSLSDPNVQRELLAAEQAGVNIGPIIEMLRAGQPPKPPETRYIEGPNGIYEIAPGQKPKMVQEYPARPNTTPGQINPQTNRWEWAPGYLESQGALTGARRDAVVARPMPQRGRASGGKTYENDDVTWN